MRQRPIASIEAETRTIDILTDIATRFYLRGESQIEIARVLGLDPSTVSRYLKRARSEGIVHIEIRPPRREDADLSFALATRYGLARAVVAPDPGDGLEPAVGAVAAEHLEGITDSGTRIGVSWGRTLADVIRNLRPGSVARLQVAQLSGGVNDPVAGIQGTDIARGLADRYPDSRVYYLHAPAIVATQAIYSAILSDPSVESALSAARQSQIALVGIGQITPAATMYRGGHVDDTDWATLVHAGAVGNMNTRFFDAAGRPVPALEDRTVAITWAEMRAIPNVIAVAAGLDKVEAIAGALVTGVVDSLITDERTARALLERQR